MANNLPSMPNDLRLVTVRRASELTGISDQFIKALLKNGKLKKRKINSAIFISMTEFELLAEEMSKPFTKSEIDELSEVIRKA